MNKKSKYNKRNFNSQMESSTPTGHSIISYYAGLISWIGMLGLSVLHWNDMDSYGSRWGRFAAFMALMGFIGWLAQCGLFSGEFHLYPKFKQIDWVETGSVGFIIFVSNVIYQIILQKLNFSISPFEQFNYSLYASVIEENFYRGFLMDMILSFDNSMFGKITSIIVSALLFTATHQNYYAYPMKLIAVFGGGLIFGIMYAYKRNLTANIIGHFALNAFIGIVSGDLGQVRVR